MEGSLNTQGNVWFAIAVMEFCVLIIIFLTKMLFSGKSKTETASSGSGEIVKLILEITHEEAKQKEESDAGRTGIITWLKSAKKNLGGSPASLMEITEADGNIFFAGIPGEDLSLFEGDSIEFWPSMDIFGKIQRLKTSDNADGTKSAWMENIQFFGLKKYRVTPPDPEEITSLDGDEILPESDARASEEERFPQTQPREGEISTADTQFGTFPDVKCEDCKLNEATLNHWGTLVPPGTAPFLCQPCMSSRHKDYVDGKAPRPIGTTAETAEPVNAT